MKNIYSLFVARNKEYYRDKGSLSWSFIIPPLIIAMISFAFSKGEPALFKVGIILSNHSHTELIDGSSLNATSAILPEALRELKSIPYYEIIYYDNLDAAKTRISHHQLDLLINPEHKQYWLNPTSQKGDVLDKLLSSILTHYQKQNVEGTRIRYIDWVIPGILAMNLMFSGLFGVGYVIVRYRKNGVLKRLQATPVRAIEFLTAQVLSRLTIMLFVSMTLYIASDIFLNFTMLGSYIDLLIVSIFGNLALISLGLVVASRISNEEIANGLLNFFSFPMMLLSEVWFSLDGAPEWVNELSALLPLTHFVQAARSIMIDGSSLADLTHHLMILAGITILCVSLSAYFFKWSPD